MPKTMSKNKTASPSIIIDSQPAESSISENFLYGQEVIPALLERPTFPISVWTPRSVPVVIGPSGFWSKALIETMYAPAKPATSFSPPSEGAGSSQITNSSPGMQDTEVAADLPED